MVPIHYLVGLLYVTGNGVKIIPSSLTESVLPVKYDLTKVINLLKSSQTPMYKLNPSLMLAIFSMILIHCLT